MEQFRIEPQVAFFNLFNRHNFNGPNGPVGWRALDNTPGATGAINNTTHASREPSLIGLGTGVFSDGSPRTIEFGIKLSF